MRTSATNIFDELPPLRRRGRLVRLTTAELHRIINALDWRKQEELSASSYGNRSERAHAAQTSRLIAKLEAALGGT